MSVGSVKDFRSCDKFMVNIVDQRDRGPKETLKGSMKRQ